MEKSKRFAAPEAAIRLWFWLFVWFEMFPSKLQSANVLKLYLI